MEETKQPNETIERLAVDYIMSMGWNSERGEGPLEISKECLDRYVSVVSNVESLQNFRLSKIGRAEGFYGGRIGFSAEYNYKISDDEINKFITFNSGDYRGRDMKIAKYERKKEVEFSERVVSALEESFGECSVSASGNSRADPSSTEKWYIRCDTPYRKIRGGCIRHLSKDSWLIEDIDIQDIFELNLKLGRDEE